MKTALIAAAALATAAFAGASDASAKDVNLALTVGGPNGYVQVGTPNTPYGPHFVKSPSKNHGKGDWNGKPGYGYGNWAPNPRYGRCVGPRQVRNRLHRQGWYGLNVRRSTPQFLLFTGYRRGTEFRLKVDRCSGHVADARPIGGSRYGIYW